MAKTSLEKSHSKASNAKLSMNCILLAIFVGAFFAGLGLMPTTIVEDSLALALIIVGAIGTICFLVAVMMFKR